MVRVYGSRERDLTRCFLDGLGAPAFSPTQREKSRSSQRGATSGTILATLDRDIEGVMNLMASWKM